MTSVHVVIIFIAFLQKFGKLEMFKFLRIIESGSERLAAFSGHPIPAAGIYTILSVISISLIFFSKIEKIARFQYILFCIILSFGIFLTQSRSFYIAYFVTIIIMLIHSRDKKLFLFTFLAIITLTVCIFFNKALSERMLSIFSVSDFSNQQRIAMWKVAHDVIREDCKNFLFGIGYGGWKVNSLQYFAKYYPSLKEAARHTHVHNIYLQIVLETGIVGLILYLSFVVLVVKKLINKMKIHKKGDFEYAYIYGVIISIFSYFIGGIFDYLHTPIILLSFYTLVAFALASGYEHS
jgi:O-antigen ligase